jgi:hypothetical protein
VGSTPTICIMNKCADCEKPLKSPKRKFCNSSCAAKYNNRGVNRHEETTTRMVSHCLDCDSEVVYYGSNEAKYCSNKCQARHKRKLFIERWEDGDETGSTKNGSLSNHIRNHLLEKHNHKCSKCGWGVVHEITGKVPLHVDHIDGDHRNNTKDNLRVLCPNCHSLTHTFGILNKGNGRYPNKTHPKYRNLVFSKHEAELFKKHSKPEDELARLICETQPMTDSAKKEKHTRKVNQKGSGTHC